MVLPIDNQQILDYSPGARLSTLGESKTKMSAIEVECRDGVVKQIGDENAHHYFY
jgi:hypothetical protein